ncbi:TorF family putative porin [Steroidobacter flavus]|uniref:TorF family putative porin n=1 Tax=Steroidobacter flavus TaxID=1842136 RepID=A0ABV8SNA2_9GAMM
MRNFRILAAVGLLGAATVANAGVTSTWTLTNDYDFRGNSQSAKDPAIQGSIDFAAANGWYVGAWGSNIDFGKADDIVADADVEVDVYTGFTGTSEGGLGWDAGLVYYTYPSASDLNYFEIYGSVSYEWFKGKLWYSDAFGGDYAKDTARNASGTDKVSAWYLEGNATFPLPKDFSILLHAGYSTGDYWDNAFGDDQIDYSVGVGYTVGKFNLALKYVDTDGDIVYKSDEFNNEGRVIFTVATTFPWSNN